MIWYHLALLTFAMSAEVSTLFVEYEGFPSSKALLETVYLQLELGISPSELVANLEEVVADIKSQDQIAIAIVANQESMCRSQEMYEQRIQQIQKNIDATQEILNTVAPELEILEGDINKKSMEIEGYRQEIEKAGRQRAADKENWGKGDKDVMENIEAAIGAIKLTSQLKYDDSNLVFIQKKLNSMSESLTNAAKLTKNDLYTPAITALAQITKSDQETIGQVIALLESLKNDLIQSKGQNAKLEEQSDSNYKEYVQSIENAIESDSQDLAGLKRKKHRMEFTVETSAAELSEDRVRIAAFADILQEQSALCDDWSRLSKIENKEREVFIKNIYQVIELVNTNIAGVREYFNNR